MNPTPFPVSRAHVATGTPARGPCRRGEDISEPARAGAQHRRNYGRRSEKGRRGNSGWREEEEDLGFLGRRVGCSLLWSKRRREKLGDLVLALRSAVENTPLLVRSRSERKLLNVAGVCSRLFLFFFFRKLVCGAFSGKIAWKSNSRSCVGVGDAEISCFLPCPLLLACPRRLDKVSAAVLA